MLPTGAAGKSYITELTNLMNGCVNNLPLKNITFKVCFLRNQVKHRPQKITSKHFSDVLIHGTVQILKNLLYLIRLGRRKTVTLKRFLRRLQDIFNLSSPRQMLNEN